MQSADYGPSVRPNDWSMHESSVTNAVFTKIPESTSTTRTKVTNTQSDSRLGGKTSIQVNGENATEDKKGYLYNVTSINFSLSQQWYSSPTLPVFSAPTKITFTTEKQIRVRTKKLKLLRLKIKVR